MANKKENHSMKTLDQDRALLNQPLLLPTQQTTSDQLFTAINIDTPNHKKVNHQLFLTLNYLSGRDLAQFMLVNKSFLIDAYKSNLVMPQTVQRHRAFFRKQVQRHRAFLRKKIDLNWKEIKQSRALEDYNSSTHPYKMIHDWYNLPELSSEKKRLILSRYSLVIAPYLVTAAISPYLTIVSFQSLLLRLNDWFSHCDKDQDKSLICILAPFFGVFALVGCGLVNVLIANIIFSSSRVVINWKVSRIISDNLDNSTLRLYARRRKLLEQINLKFEKLVPPPNGDKAQGDPHNDHTQTDVTVQILR